MLTAAVTPVSVVAGEILVVGLDYCRVLIVIPLVLELFACLFKIATHNSVYNMTSV